MAGPWTGPARLQRNGGGQPGVHHVPATSGKTKDRSARFSTKNSRTASTSSFLSHAVPAFATMSLISEMVGSLSSSRTACCLPSGTLSDMTGAILERTRRLQAREINILRRGKYYYSGASPASSFSPHPSGTGPSSRRTCSRAAVPTSCPTGARRKREARGGRHRS